MREIKLRAWDEENEIMCIPEFQASFNEGRYPINKFFDNSLSDKFIFMQFTGLHDKNGKEIYEGDIFWLSRSYKNGKSSASGTITEHNFHEIVVEIKRWIANNGNVKVLGNIYENKNLLK